MNAQSGMSRGRVVLATVVFLLAALALATAVQGPPTVRVSEEVAVQCLNESAWPATAGEGWHLKVAGHEVPEIRVVSRRALEVISLRFEDRASSSIELEGGSLGERVLLPDGGVVFEVLPAQETARRHWWPLGARYRYALRWVMPQAKAGPIGLTLGAEPAP